MIRRACKAAVLVGALFVVCCAPYYPFLLFGKSTDILVCSMRKGRMMQETPAETERWQSACKRLRS